jgi:tellurite resistance protein TerC
MSSGSPLVWTLFAAVVILALAVDLGIFHRHAHVVRIREAAIWTAVWAALALGFNGFIYYRFGGVKAAEFLQGYLLEYALSIDNVFVFLIVFRYFKVPQDQLHRVLFWGIIGAVVSRGIFIGAGAVIISRFHWVMYILGLFLVYTGIKIVFQKDGEVDPGRNPALRIFRRLVPTVSSYQGQKFLIRKDGRTFATPLLVVLVVVEMTDVMFAVDSIPAIFGVTTDVFIVFTSNIFAILGLRSLFFLIEGLVAKLRYLKVGVAAILTFIGVKILIKGWWEMPVLLSLGILAGVLIISTIASLVFPAPKEVKPEDVATGIGLPHVPHSPHSPSSPPSHSPHPPGTSSPGPSGSAGS